MKTMSLIAVLCALIAFSGLCAWAVGPIHTKLTPYSLGYPLISPVPFPSPLRDVYQRSFGVRRMFRSVIDRDYDNTLLESLNWHHLYGGYGVLGHGEDVFTNRAARYRMRHQGR